jgi:pimeloyl-ACP methyl ester carboxylesterase
LVVAGGDDAVVPLADVEALRDAIPGARLRVLDGAGHSAPAEQSEAFNAAVDEFVAGLPPGGS